jgi:hypothetical protein
MPISEAIKSAIRCYQILPSTSAGGLIGSIIFGGVSVSVLSSPLVCSRGWADDGSWFIRAEWFWRVVRVVGIHYPRSVASWS